MKKIYTLLLLLVPGVSTLMGQLNINHQHFSVIDGLSGNDITSIMEHSSGFMYMATQNGLNRFDGKNFEQYKAIHTRHQEPRLRNDYISAMAEDSQGWIWFTNKDNQLYRFDPYLKQFSYPQLLDNHRQPVGAPATLYKTPNGRLWIAPRGQGLFEVQTNDGGAFAYRHFHQGNGLYSDTVKNVVCDHYGTTWILSTGGVSYYPPQQNQPEKVTWPADAGTILALCPDGQQGVLLATSHGALYRYLPGSGQVVLVAHPFRSAASQLVPMAGNRLVAVFSDSEGVALCSPALGTVTHRIPGAMGSRTVLHCDTLGVVWVVPEQPEVISLDVATRVCKRFKGSYAPIKDVSYHGAFIEAPDGRLLIRLSNGEIYYYSRQQGAIRRFEGLFAHQQAYLHSVKWWCLDRQDNLWLHTYYNGGIDKIDISYSPFGTIPVPTTLRGETADIRAILRDNQGTIWVGTKDGRVLLYTPSFELQGSLSAQGKLEPNTVFYPNGVYALGLDRKGQVWIGTRGGGLYLCTRQGRGFGLRHFGTNAHDAYSINNDHIYQITCGSNGQLAIGTWGGGVNVLEIQQGQYRFYHPDNYFKDYPKEFRKTRSVTLDDYGRIWVAGQHSGLLCIDKQGRTPYTIYTSDGPGAQLSSSDVHTLCYTRHHRLFVGTNDAGITELVLTSPDTVTATYHNSLNKFPSDVIRSIIADTCGNLFVPIHSGVARLNYLSKEIALYRSADLDHITFTANSVCLLDTARLLLGSKNGMLTLNTAIGNKRMPIPQLVFTRLTVSNHDVCPGDSTAILTNNIDKANSIVLKHTQATFEIECATLDYRRPTDIQYAYMLEGLDKDWIYQRNNNVISFWRMPAGKYTLKVKSTDSNGAWLHNERSIEIEVLNPLYKTTGAYMVYALLLLGLVALSARILATIYKLKEKIKMEKQLAEHKMAFMTTISHELRTPLTLIHTPLEHILSTKESGGELWRDLDMVYRNSGRLIKLVNQLLDFRALQYGTLSVRHNTILVAEFVSSLAQSFSHLARQRKIVLEVESDCDAAVIVSDRDKIEAIVFNLISNAIKHSTAGGKVQLRLHMHDNQILFSIQDYGAGMPKEYLKHIFTPFYTASNSHSDLQPSTGIGMALVKEYCDLLGISIDIQSKLGEGTTVSLRIAAHTLAANTTTDDALPIQEQHVVPQGQNNSTTDAGATILLVEDNTELRDYMARLLSPYYTVVAASNGTEGLTMAKECAPDLILSDILMPGKSGVEFVEEFRSNVDTSHIPIIVVSAIDDLSTKKKLLQLGADDYIVKPFVSSLLLARIANILEQRRMLRMLYSSKIGQPLHQSEPVPTHDKELIERINAYMDLQLSSSEISVDDLCNAAKLPYHTLKAKMKQLLGLTPLEFIKEYRMQRAAELIRSGQYSIKDITYKVGINDQRYFSRCFKDRYGVTPTEYKNQFMHEQQA